ncbi:MAG: C40 family peptidase [Candidatus Omnitrophica bacterium]|nr:C40 family peptidase [Candidatus Omnitrophota bacterium]
MRPILLFASTLTLIAGGTPPALAAAETPPRLMRVAAAVADLRREPAPPGPSRDHDPLEESQLLYGEPARLLEEKGGWARVEVIEQAEWTHHRRWEGYPGWVRLSDLTPDDGAWSPNLVVTAKVASVRPAPDRRASPKMRLSMGTALQGIPVGDSWKLTMLDGSTGWIARTEAADLAARPAADQAPPREGIVRAARLFLGDPYYWGGRSAYEAGAKIPPHTGADCSGLVGLAYRANGWKIPRDAHEQWLKARPISQEELQPADLIFLADPSDPKKVTHVMLYAGQGRAIEGPGTGKPVREIGLEERLKEARGRRAYFGRYLP